MSAKSKNRKQGRTIRRGRLALALAAVLMAPAAWGQSLPDSGAVVSGAATSNLDVGGVMNPGGAGTAMTITQSTPTAIINWASFNVGAGATLSFVQPDSSSVLLNRVVGDPSGLLTPSIIDGSIASNGNIFLVNAMGILFGAGSSVNVGGLVASTLDITDADFIAGAGMANPHYVFTAGSPIAGGAIVNQGALSTTAGSSGTIALLAARIENQQGGTISAPGGSVVFGAASGANLDFYGDGLTTVTLTGNGLDLDMYCSFGPVSTSSCLGGIESLGDIFAQGGHVEMRTQTQDGNPQPIGTGLFTEAANGGRIWIGGRIDARTVGATTGSIILDAGMGNVDIGGVSGQTAWVNATGVGAGENAGTIQIRGNQLFTYLCVGPGGVCTTNDSLGFIDASGYNSGNGGHIQIDVLNLFYNAGVIQAASRYGAGGTIDITAGSSAENYNWIIAEGANGGTINITAPSILLHRGQLPWLGGSDILYSQAVLSAYGSNGNGGTVNLAGALDVLDLGNVTPADPEFASIVNVRGMNGNGGTVHVFGGSSNIGSTWFANASGTQDGGIIQFDALSGDVVIAAQMEANGQRDGGHILINGGYIDMSGAVLYANGSRDGGIIRIEGTDVILSGLFNAVGNAGRLDTTAYNHLFIDGSTTVSASNWYIGGSEVWLTTAAGASAHAQGAVVVDQALATALGYGTWILMRADNGTFNPTGSGALTIDPGVSILPTGVLPGRLDMRAFNGISGSGFAIDAGYGVYFDSYGSSIQLDNFTLGGGSVGMTGDSISLASGYINTYGGGFAATAVGAAGGIDIYSTWIDDAGSGDVTLDAANTEFGIQAQWMYLTASGGDVVLNADGSLYGGVHVRNSGITSAGDITMTADGSYDGVMVGYYSLVDSGGDITMTADGSPGGITINGFSSVYSRGGDINLSAYASGNGIRVDYSSVTTTSGDITIAGAGAVTGVALGSGSALASTSGNIEITGQGGNGAGVAMASGSSVDAGSGTVVIRAGSGGSGDAITLAGSIASTTAVNLRPLDETDAIHLGGGNGFVLDGSDLAGISSPWLVIGSAQQQGLIQVLGNLAYAGNLTLQNQGGGNGILLDATLDTSGYTLALLAGGSIVQGAGGLIRAESLLAVAADDVLLDAVANEVSANTLAGSAGGSFAFLNAGALSIGNVNAFGFATTGGGLYGYGGSGLSGSSVLVRNLSGNLTLNASVSGGDVDLVTAGVFLNPGGHTISASNAWRVWASTWVGEDRGGLAGSGTLPNLYNCTYLGSCGVTVSGGENHFIYAQQPFLTVTVDDATREYGESDPALTYTITGLIFPDDDPASVYSVLLSSGTSATSNVGSYAINGSFSSLAGYGFNLVPGFLTITPATLLFTADSLIWYMGMPFPVMTGTVTGFKNGETLAQIFPNGVSWEAVFGPSGQPLPGYHPIFGFGTGNPQNYVIAQAPSNLTALYLLPPESSSRPLEFISDPSETYVYERNFDAAQVCPIGDMESDSALAGGDPLGNEWSKVRRRLNLLNCFSNDRRGGCGSF